MPEPAFTTTDYLEQYKAYLGDLGNVGSRYATSNGFFVSVLSALLTVLALAEHGKVLGEIPKPTLWVVCLFSCVLCLVWMATIRFYRALFAAKFQVLWELERKLPVQCFQLEYEKIGPKKHLLAIENYAPLVLLLLFVAIGALGS